MVPYGTELKREYVMERTVPCERAGSIGAFFPSRHQRFCGLGVVSPHAEETLNPQIDGPLLPLQIHE